MLFNALKAPSPLIALAAPPAAVRSLAICETREVDDEVPLCADSSASNVWALNIDCVPFADDVDDELEVEEDDAEDDELVPFSAARSCDSGSDWLVELVCDCHRA